MADDGVQMPPPMDTGQYASDLFSLLSLGSSEWSSGNLTQPTEYSTSMTDDVYVIKST